jgi:hypothetical protein
MDGHISVLGKRDDQRTADLAILVTMLFGSSKFSIPSETRSCWACAEIVPVVDSLRGMIFWEEFGEHVICVLSYYICRILGNFP